MHLCELKGLPAKGPQRSRTYWTAARVSVRKCTKKCRAARCNDKDTSLQLNEELSFLGSAGDIIQVTVSLDFSRNSWCLKSEDCLHTGHKEEC